MKIILTLAILIFITFSATANNAIPPGEYLELFLGAKSGGSNEHQVLVTTLRKDVALDGFAFFCISGRSRASDSSVPGYAIERERRLPPVLAKSCKGSAAILMGPVQGENIERLNKHLNENYLHLYSDIRVVR